MIRSTFFGLEIGKSGLVLSQLGLDVTGHNIANVDTVGYTRQRLVHTAYDPFGKIGRTAPISQANVGGGAYVKVHDQIRSAYLDRRFRTENTINSYWQKRTESLRYLESYFDNVVEETSINFSIGRFFEAMKVLAEDTVESAPRTLLQTAGKDLVQQFNTIYEGIVDLQESQNLLVRTTVDAINSIAKDIVELNKSIFGFELTGHPANDLRDKRNLLIDELSKYIDVEYDEYSDGKGNSKHRVKIGGQILTDHDIYNQLTVKVAANKIAGEADILVPVWVQNQALLGDLPLVYNSGEDIVGNNTQDLVDMYNRLAELINTLNGEIKATADKLPASFSGLTLAGLQNAINDATALLNDKLTDLEDAQNALRTAQAAAAALESAKTAFARAESRYNAIQPNYTVAYTALTAANSALGTANSALATANTALDTANNALTAALAALAVDPDDTDLQAAVTAARDAVTAARNAVTLAQANQRTAQSEQRSAQTAFNRAETGILALNKAQAALEAAQTAYDDTDAANIDTPDGLKDAVRAALAARNTAQADLDNLNQLDRLISRRDAAADKIGMLTDGVVTATVPGASAGDPLEVSVNIADPVDGTIKVIPLVDSNGVRNLATIGESTTYVDLVVTGGELKAYIDMRDGDGVGDNAKGIPYYIEMLNNLARALVQEINAVHRQGWTYHPVEDSKTGVNFFNEDGYWLDSTGTQATFVPDGAGGWLDAPGGDPVTDFTGYSWYSDISGITAKNIRLSDAVNKNAYNIAGSSVQIVKKGQPHELQAGNNENMNAMYALFLRKNINLENIAGGSVGSFDGYATSIRFDLGNTLNFAIKTADNSNTLALAAENQRVSVSGVSLDEEMTTMIRYNHAYNGAARVITAMDDMLDKLINGTGRCGL